MTAFSKRRLWPATAALAAALVALSPARSDTILVWKVGSPHAGDTPNPRVPAVLQKDAAAVGARITVEAYPAAGFAARLSDAVTRNAAPDLLVFGNFGVMRGSTTALGTFAGIGQDAAIRQHLVRVEGPFDALLGPERGWTYLFAISPNHRTARALAEKAPACPNGSSAPPLPGELGETVFAMAPAYLNGDAATLQTFSDLEKLPGVRATTVPVMPTGVPLPVPGGGAGAVTTRGVRPCGVWGNERLAFARVHASYESADAIGHTPLLLVLRKSHARWQLLVAARDPVSTGAFLNSVPSIAARFASDVPARAFPSPATLLSPPDGVYPRPANGERFGAFSWRSSPSSDVVAEIAEFAYHDDARLFRTSRRRPEALSDLSAGNLWRTNSTWTWRVWSVSASGDVAFSEARTFPH
jgi:hypothetical protein